MSDQTKSFTTDAGLARSLICAPTPGVFLTNNERDVSQSDFKCRIMPQTTLKVAPHRDSTG